MLDDLMMPLRHTRSRPAQPVSPFSQPQTGVAAPSAFRLMIRDARRVWFPPRWQMSAEGDTARHVYFIRSGLVKLISHLPNGRERIVRLHGRGAWIGLGGLLNPVAAHAVVTVGRVEAYRLPLQELRRLKETKPGLYCSLTETWYECLQEADLWITQFSCGSVRARVARLVNFLASLDPRGAPSEVALLTCEEMAGILAVTPESVSRAVAEFKRSGFLRPEASDSRPVRYRRDKEALLALSNEC